MLKKDSRFVMGLHLHKFGVRYFRPKFLKLFRYFKKKILNSAFNSYRQIPETISKKRAATQGIFWKLFPDYFQIT